MEKEITTTQMHTFMAGRLHKTATVTIRNNDLNTNLCNLHFNVL